MTELTQSEIIKKYPELFGEPPFDPMKTLIAFGFEVSKYWLPILDRGFEKISKIIKEKELTDFRIVQVKEKFGMLSVYCNFYVDEVDKVIDEMESGVATICEKCGSLDGIYRTDGWMRIECDACFGDGSGYP